MMDMRANKQKKEKMADRIVIDASDKLLLLQPAALLFVSLFVISFHILLIQLASGILCSVIYH